MHELHWKVYFWRLVNPDLHTGNILIDEKTKTINLSISGKRTRWKQVWYLALMKFTRSTNYCAPWVRKTQMVLSIGQLSFLIWEGN